nr:immunoglobulin heavy chain junction region [Homo sapiens]
SKNTLYLQMNS